MELIYNIAIIIPVYNEERTITKVIDEIFYHLPKARVYVFDNNSNDDSFKLVESKISTLGLDSNEASLELIRVSLQGKGAVIREAFAMIDADIYVMIDADTQYETSILPSALRYFINNRLDMLNISRQVENEAIHRRWHNFGNRFFSQVASLLFGRKCSDLLSGYRVFSKAFVKSFPAHSQGFEIETELSIFALQQHLRIDEMPATYKARPQGSYSKLSTFRDGFKILFMIIQLLFTERPLFVFGGLSFISFVIGLILGIPIVFEFMETSKVLRFPTLFVCIGFGIISVILGIAGLLSFLIARSTKEVRHFIYLQYKSL